MKPFPLLALLALTLPGSAAASLYLAAHADDIELFMAKNAWLDVQQGDHSVFVLTTAGDEGHGDYVPNGTGQSFMRARREGHERAIRFWLASGGTALGATVRAQVSVNGKLVDQSVIGGRLTLYYLNLPDGSYGGAGYAATGNQSLARLLDGSIATITSVDQSNPASYSLPELRATLQAIVMRHIQGNPSPWVNMLDENWSFNPYEHADHASSGRLMAMVLAAPWLRCVNLARYTSYGNAERAINLAPDDQRYHAATWGILNSGLIDGGNPATWNSEHNAWLGKQFFRVQAGNGGCGFP